MRNRQNVILVVIAVSVALVALSASAQEPLKKVDSKQVCMINERYFAKDQIPLVFEGRTYYGCCNMCKERLEKDPASRIATDPLSGKTVDKAVAVIAADADGNVMYFENEKNLQKFNSKKK